MSSNVVVPPPLLLTKTVQFPPTEDPERITRFLKTMSDFMEVDLSTRVKTIASVEVEIDAERADAIGLLLKLAAAEKKRLAGSGKKNGKNGKKSG